MKNGSVFGKPIVVAPLGVLCDWGSATAAKVTKFEMSVLKENSNGWQKKGLNIFLYVMLTLNSKTGCSDC